MLLFTGAHMGQDGLNKAQRAGEVSVHHLLQLLRRGFFDGAEQAIAGIVDQDVDMPQCREGFSNSLSCVRLP